MIEFRVDHNIPEVQALIAKAPEYVERAVDRALSRGAQELAREARAEAPKGANSHLTNSINAERLGLMDYRVAAGMDYASMVHDGTGAGGNPPIKSLMDWLRAKRISPRDPEMSQRDLAYVMARHIRLHGTKENKFMLRALNNKRSRLAELVAKESGVELSRL